MNSMPAQSLRKVRYAVVGLGHIAQHAVIPAFQHAASNSELVGLVSDDRSKVERLGTIYGIKHSWTYDQYRECLSSGLVDAVYIALPNSMHKQYTIEALEAGRHVLCEKPMALTPEDCRQMIEAARKSQAKLMVAYRLHFEQANLSVVDLVNSGSIGEAKIFSSVFSMQVQDDNIRTKAALGGGAIYDLGVYCINAARYIFRDEPVEVMAFNSSNSDPRFAEVEEMTSAVLRFPRDRLAIFTCSFGAADCGWYQVVGTQGSIIVNPAYDYEQELSYTLNVNGKTRQKTFPKADQFAPEIMRFSQAILANLQVESSGQEGLADILVIEGIKQSARCGRSIKLEAFSKTQRPDREQELTVPPVPTTPLIDVQPPTR